MDGLVPCSLCHGAGRVPDDWTEEMIRGKPHPDTARADAAERILELLANRMSEDEVRGLCIANPAFASWWADWRAEHRRNVRRLADLTAERDRQRAALAKIEAELAALTEGKT